eukprot:4487355-Pleurochrysis_carterae.AAC.1
MGFAAPATGERGGASGDDIWALLELVMAMGWTRASGIAQDAGNCLMRTLLLLVDSELEAYVSARRREVPEFEAYWRQRMLMPHDDTYGTQARL